MAKPPPSPHTETITIDPSNKEHMKLFKETFMKKGGLYERQFPDKGEREDPKETLEYMKDGSGVVSIMVRTDPATKKQEPVGFSYANVFDATNPETGQQTTGVLVAYIAKDNLAEQRTGERFPAQTIMEANLSHIQRTSDKPIGIVGWEANNPEKFSLGGVGGKREDSMPPEQRLNIVGKYGFTQTGINYLAPPLEGGNKGVADDGMHFLVAGVKVQGDRVSIQPTKLDTPEKIGAVQGMMTAYYGDMEASRHPALQQQVLELEAMKSGMGKGSQEAAQVTGKQHSMAGLIPDTLLKSLAGALPNRGNEKQQAAFDNKSGPKQQAEIDKVHEAANAVNAAVDRFKGGDVGQGAGGGGGRGGGGRGR